MEEARGSDRHWLPAVPFLMLFPTSVCASPPLDLCKPRPSFLLPPVGLPSPVLHSEGPPSLALTVCVGSPSKAPRAGTQVGGPQNID